MMGWDRSCDTVFFIIKHEYGSIQHHYISYDSSYPNPNTFITFNCPPEIVITAKVAEVVSEVVQLIFDPATVGFKLADFPAVFFHISHWYLSWNTAGGGDCI